MTSVPSARSAGETPGEAQGTSADPVEPTAEQRAAAARARAARRALALALLFGALGAALALIASGQVWSHSTASFAHSRLPVVAKGSEVTGLPSALGLVGLAALVAVFAVRRAARQLVAVLLTLCGAGTLLSALLSADDTAPLDDKAAKVSGLAQSGVDVVFHVSAWPYVSVAGGVLLLCAGLLALRYGPGWPSMSGSGRYERGSRKPRGAVAVDPDRPEDLWKALDRGEDPTHGTA